MGDAEMQAAFDAEFSDALKFDANVPPLRSSALPADGSDRAAPSAGSFASLLQASLRGEEDGAAAAATATPSCATELSQMSAEQSAPAVA